MVLKKVEPVYLQRMKNKFKSDFNLCEKVLHWSPSSVVSILLLGKGHQATKPLDCFPSRERRGWRRSMQCFWLVPIFARKKQPIRDVDFWGRITDPTWKSEERLLFKNGLAWNTLTSLQSFWSLMMFVLLYTSSIWLLFSWGTKIWWKKETLQDAKNILKILTNIHRMVSFNLWINCEWG